jgi:hypothetical protein
MYLESLAIKREEKGAEKKLHAEAISAFSRAQIHTNTFTSSAATRLFSAKHSQLGSRSLVSVSVCALLKQQRTTHQLRQTR